MTTTTPPEPDIPTFKAFFAEETKRRVYGRVDEVTYVSISKEGKGVGIQHPGDESEHEYNEAAVHIEHPTRDGFAMSCDAHQEATFNRLADAVLRRWGFDAEPFGRVIIKTPNHREADYVYFYALYAKKYLLPSTAPIYYFPPRE
ncbi:MAG: hypothetical protein WC483_00420 [Candidatus Paceibacterota bacterium]